MIRWHRVAVDGLRCGRFGRGMPERTAERYVGRARRRAERKQFSTCNPVRCAWQSLASKQRTWLLGLPVGYSAAHDHVKRRASSARGQPSRGRVHIRHTPRTKGVSNRIPRPGIGPGLAASKTAVRPTHSQGFCQLADQAMPSPGIEPGLRPSESRVRIRHTPRANWRTPRYPRRR
jgi:hypothetical protein